MLAMSLASRIIACLDIRCGRVVKGVRFATIKDAGDPVAVAKKYDKQGIDEIIFLDITASNEDRVALSNMVSAVADEVFIPLTVGGGISSTDDIKAMLDAGADKVAINSAAVYDKKLIEKASNYFGSQCIVIAIDAKRISATSNKWEVFTHGGKNPTGIDVLEWAIKNTQNKKHNGAGEILLTSMDMDGTQEGFDLELTKTVSEAVDVPVIASGGVGSLAHLVDGIKKGMADAVLAASIFHYNTHSVAQAKLFMQQNGIEVRF